METDNQINAAIDALIPFGRYLLRNVYDRPGFPQDAVRILCPHFEYPSWDYRKVSEFIAFYLREHCRKQEDHI